MQLDPWDSKRLSWIYEQHAGVLPERVTDQIDKTHSSRVLPDVDTRHLIHMLNCPVAVFSQLAAYTLVTGNKLNEPYATFGFLDVVFACLLGDISASSWWWPRTFLVQTSQCLPVGYDRIRGQPAVN